LCSHAYLCVCIPDREANMLLVLSIFSRKRMHSIFMTSFRCLFAP
jgi:hypothetical protein